MGRIDHRQVLRRNGVYSISSCFLITYNGAGNRIRTDDLRITNASLYQLSYPGAGKKAKGRTQKAEVKGGESKGRRGYELAGEMRRSGERVSSYKVSVRTLQSRLVACALT